MKAILLFLMMMTGFAVMAQKNLLEQPVAWSFDLNDDSKIIFEAEISEGWHIYSQFSEEGGPVPLSFDFDDENGYERIGDVSEHGAAISVYSDLFEIEVIKFKEVARFEQEVKLLEKGVVIKGYLTYMACDGKKCLPPTDIPFELKT